MKTVNFRPLRINKKTGKIIVASYMQWRKVKTADHQEFELIIDNEYNTMPPDAYVHDHMGELLFFYRSLPANGLDIEGVPTFSHFTADYLGTHKFEPFDFEPLTVKMVVEWYGWFLLNLEKAKIEVKMI